MKVIGLKRGTVQLKAHNPRWIKLFEREKKLLLKNFPEQILEVSHGGSTAISTIPAKPIIDMFAVIPSLQEAKFMRKELETLGYHYIGKKGVRERILYVKGKEENRTHHLQLVERKSSEWQNHLLLKNYYVRYPEVAREYAKLKKNLAKKYPKDRESYSKGKDTFIKSVIARAKKSSGRRRGQ